MRTEIIRRVLLALLAGALLSGCKKLWEEERLEIIRCPQMDVQPEIPEWENS